MRWLLLIFTVMASVPAVWAVDAIELAQSSRLLNPAPDYKLGVKP